MLLIFTACCGLCRAWRDESDVYRRTDVSEGLQPKTPSLYLFEGWCFFYLAKAKLSLCGDSVQTRRQEEDYARRITAASIPAAKPTGNPGPAAFVPRQADHRTKKHGVYFRPPE